MYIRIYVRVRTCEARYGRCDVTAVSCMRQCSSAADISDIRPRTFDRFVGAVKCPPLIKRRHAPPASADAYTFVSMRYTMRFFHWHPCATIHSRCFRLYGNERAQMIVGVETYL